MMDIQVMKSKLHCVTVTQAELDYIGSISIDEDLMDAANLIENEQVHILNKNNDLLCNLQYSFNQNARQKFYYL